jgi:hypothetical protein
MGASQDVDAGGWRLELWSTRKTGSVLTATGLPIVGGSARLDCGAPVQRSMSDLELKAVAAQVKKLTARVEALERLLERILRQKPSPRGSWRGCLGVEA